MEAVQFSTKDNKLEHVRTPRPKAEHPHDVIIKVYFSGICRTDLHIIDVSYNTCHTVDSFEVHGVCAGLVQIPKGFLHMHVPVPYRHQIGLKQCMHDELELVLPCNANKPVCLGHEFSGVVSSVGEAVRLVKKGDKVVADPNSGCGLCDLCRRGNPHYCNEGYLTKAIGRYKNGGWADYVLVPEAQVHKIPEGLTIEQAVLAEPMACITHGWDMLLPVAVGRTILIIGCGLVGDLWAAFLHFQGFRKITISENNLARLEYIEKFPMGFDCITPDILRERQESGSHYLFDLIIDTSGSAESIDQGISLLNAGGKLCIFGVKPPEVKISVSPFLIQQKEIEIIGVNSGTFNFSRALDVLESLGDKYLDFESLGIKSYPLREFSDAIKHVRNGSVVKAMFSMAINCTCSNKKRDSIRS